MEVKYPRDEYLTVRNIPVPKSLIRKLAQEFSAVLVTENNLLIRLDSELANFIQKNGREPDLNKEMFRFPGDANWYTYAPLPIPLDMILPGSKEVLSTNKKPIWFAIPRVFLSGTSLTV